MYEKNNKVLTYPDSPGATLMLRRDFLKPSIDSLKVIEKF